METTQRIIISNNPKVIRFVKESICPSDSATLLIDCPSREAVYQSVRDHIHRNWELQNHAMYGNIQPHKQPYRSMILTRGTELDVRGLTLWEQAMERSVRRPCPPYTEKVLEDFQELDFILFTGNNPAVKL